MSNVNFIEKCDELNKKIQELEVNKKVAQKQVEQNLETVRELVGKLNELPIPVVNGEPVINFKIDSEKLGQPVYAREICQLLPGILTQLETTGTQLIDSALVQKN